MQIKEIMTREVVSVRPDTKVVEVARLLTSKAVHGVPVINKKDIVVGIITLSDFFIKGYPDLYLPSYIDFLKKTSFHDKLDPKQKEHSAKLMKATAEDIMTKDCVTVPEEMDTNDLLERYSTSSLKTIPVTNSAGKIVGIVARSDIFKLIKI